MSTHLAQFQMSSPDETADLAKAFAKRIQPGDTLLLAGDIGAGKTHFARSLIQALQDVPEDVPSPTFTLIQTYDSAKGEIVHADLYRLGHGDELVELGMVDAFGNLICLVEWPDRLGTDAPQDALTLSFRTGDQGDARTISAHGDATIWKHRLPEHACV